MSTRPTRVASRGGRTHRKTERDADAETVTTDHTVGGRGVGAVGAVVETVEVVAKVEVVEGCGR